MLTVRNLPVWILLTGAGLLAAACSSEGYLEEADNEVYNIIQEKQQVVMGKTDPFSIDVGEDLESLRRQVEAKFGDGEEDLESSEEEQPEPGKSEQALMEILQGVDEEHPLSINLNEALKIAFKLNRNFMQEKEALYLDALNLTFQRHLWTPQLAGMLGGEARRTEDGQRYVSGESEFSVTQLLATGGEMGLTFATDLLKVYSGGSDESASSLLSFNFLQPLWRGFGSLVAKENLTQAERNVAYSIRSFERYRKDLAVEIASDYYNVLQQKDVVENEHNNYRNLIENRKRAELMAQAGRMPEFQVDQTMQNELSARNRWIAAQERYDQLLDSFKIRLGLPTDTPTILDAKDLQDLTVAGLEHPDLDPDEAMEHALMFRLDLMNARDRVDDARRRVVVSEDGLGPDLDFSFHYTIGTDYNEDGEPYRKPLKFQPQHPDYGVGLELDLPLDRKSERNAFRQSLIDLERQKRAQTFLVDRIKQSVRQSYRRLVLAWESYGIQKQALALAEKRVESTNLLQEAGRAETRDFLEAQEALLSAQNALTVAVVEHTIARLEFLLNIESLGVRQNGLIASLDEKKAMLESLKSKSKGPVEDEQPTNPDSQGENG